MGIFLNHFIDPQFRLVLFITFSVMCFPFNNFCLFPALELFPSFHQHLQIMNHLEGSNSKLVFSTLLLQQYKQKLYCFSSFFFVIEPRIVGMIVGNGFALLSRGLYDVLLLLLFQLPPLQIRFLVGS